MVPSPFALWIRSWSREIVAPDARRYILRLLRTDDTELLTEYFLSLSEYTKLLYGPHPFDRPTAERLCAEQEPTTLRLLAIEELSGAPRLAAYFILFLKLRPGDAARHTHLPVDESASLAPSVRDDRQSSGLGSVIMPEVLAIARRAGMRRLVLCGGVQARNGRAYHFYQKWGFVKVREFATQIMNYDMVRELEGTTQDRQASDP